MLGAPMRKVLSEALSCLADEGQELVFRNLDNCNAMAFSFRGKMVRRLIIWNEQRLGPLLLMGMALIKQSPPFYPGELRHLGRD